MKPEFFTEYCTVTITIGTRQKNKKHIDWRLCKLNAQLLKDEFFLAEARKLLQQAGLKADHVFVRVEPFEHEVKQLAINKANTLNFCKRQLAKQLQPD